MRRLGAAQSLVAVREPEPSGCIVVYDGASLQSEASVQQFDLGFGEPEGTIVNIPLVAPQEAKREQQGLLEGVTPTSLIATERHTLHGDESLHSFHMLQ